MRKVIGMFVLFLCLLLTGCGKEEAQYCDIVSEEQPFSEIGVGKAYFLNMQFYKGEPVQIWAVQESAKINLYLYKKDGSREILLKDVPEYYASGYGYVDNEGNYYRWNSGGSLSKTDTSGKRLFSRKLSEWGMGIIIKRLCQAADGKLYVLYYQADGGGFNQLGILDSSTGELAKVSNAVSSLSVSNQIGADKEGLCYLREHGVEKVNVEAGHVEELWPFNGTTYHYEYDWEYPVWDFLIRDDGSLELLRADIKGQNGIIETLRKEPVGEGKRY